MSKGVLISVVILLKLELLISMQLVFFVHSFSLLVFLAAVLFFSFNESFILEVSSTPSSSLTLLLV